MVVEYVLKIAGEMCVHFVIVIGTSLAIAYYLENLQQDATTGAVVSTFSAEVNSVVLTTDSVVDSESATTIQTLQETVADAIVTAIANITEQGVESEL